jgi:hypothetical protein
MNRFLSLAIVSVALVAAAGNAVAVVVVGPGPVGPILPPRGPIFWGPPPPPPWTVRAPEIDPASALAGLTLLAGGLAVLRGRRGRKSGD